MPQVAKEASALFSKNHPVCVLRIASSSSSCCWQLNVSSHSPPHIKIELLPPAQDRSAATLEDHNGDSAHSHSVSAQAQACSHQCSIPHLQTQKSLSQQEIQRTQDKPLSHLYSLALVLGHAAHPTGTMIINGLAAHWLMRESSACLTSFKIIQQS